MVSGTLATMSTQPTHLDMTTPEIADRVSSAISAFVAVTAMRMALNPHAKEVSHAEMATYDEMRAAIHDMATTEYDRGYRTAMRQRNSRA